MAVVMEVVEMEAGEETAVTTITTTERGTMGMETGIRMAAGVATGIMTMVTAVEMEVVVVVAMAQVQVQVRQKLATETPVMAAISVMTMVMEETGEMVTAYSAAAEVDSLATGEELGTTE